MKLKTRMTIGKSVQDVWEFFTEPQKQSYMQLKQENPNLIGGSINGGRSDQENV